MACRDGNPWLSKHCAWRLTGSMTRYLPSKHGLPCWTSLCNVCLTTHCVYASSVYIRIKIESKGANDQCYKVAWEDHAQKVIHFYSWAAIQGLRERTFATCYTTNIVATSKAFCKEAFSHRLYPGAPAVWQKPGTPSKPADAMQEVKGF